MRATERQRGSSQTRPAWPGNAVRAVLDWGLPRLRDLPWRATRDPWLVLVAEVMLQQTQARRVVPAWYAFCAAYPTPRACADAALGDVLRAWQGLGYPRRARDLHGAAHVIVTRHGGRVPDDLAALLDLPGVGRYTARAVLAFAFERDVAVVETNIARVLARVAGRRLTLGEVQAVADSLVPAGAGWAWNQAMMDLGATVCRPAPACAGCPVRDGCGWRLAGHPDPDPAVGSAAVSGRQAPYEGSHRQARGRVLRRLARGPAPADGFPPAIVAGLIADRLVVRTGSELQLP
jgi:A/G-specific adenine glycosylase